MRFASAAKACTYTIGCSFHKLGVLVIISASIAIWCSIHSKIFVYTSHKLEISKRSLFQLHTNKYQSLN